MRTVDEIKKDIAKVDGRLEYIGELESKMVARKESLEKELKDVCTTNDPFTLTNRYGDKCDELDTIWFINDLGYVDCLDANHGDLCDGYNEWVQKYQHLKTVNNNTAGVYASKETAEFALKQIRLSNVMLYFKDKYDSKIPFSASEYTIRYSPTNFEYYFINFSDYHNYKHVSGGRDPFVIRFHSVQAVERCISYLNSHKEQFS